MGRDNKKRHKNHKKKINRQNMERNKKEDIPENNPEDVNDGEINDEVLDEVDSSELSSKRQYSGDDSDHEDDQPKKKKKKKQPVVTDTTDKGKKSIRQMKRERHAQRQAEAQAVSKDALKGQCLNYLSQWKHDKQNWKFMKAKQGWLYKNKFSTSLLPDSSWPLLLEYFQSAQGNIRKMLLEDAKKIITQMDEWTESQTGSQPEPEEDAGDKEENSEEPKNIKPDESIYKRARDLIQCLEE